MATRRDWLATQFEITENDKAENGLVASTLAMGKDTIEGMLVSDNLFLRKLGTKAQELENATLPDYLITERADWEKAIQKTQKSLKAEYLAHSKAWAQREKALKDLLSETEVAVLADNAQSTYEQEQEPVFERLETAKGRLAKIALFPANAINAEFLDYFSKVAVPGNGNGVREPVEGKVWKVNLDGVFFYVAVESGDKYRIYDTGHKLIKDNTDFPGERITSRTRAKKVCYIGHYKGWSAVTGQPWGKVASGGTAGTQEHSTIENFVIE